MRDVDGPLGGDEAGVRGGEGFGAPMVRTYKRRYNAAGEGIGPEMRIRSCDALLFWRVQERVLVAIERAAERQR